MGPREFNLGYILPDSLTGNIPMSHYGTREPESKRKAAFPPVEFDLSIGVHPHGPAKQYPALKRQITEKIIRLMMNTSDFVDEKIADRIIRRTYGLDELPYIVFGHLGSNEILERIFTQMIHNRTESGSTLVVGIQPQFPQVEYFLRRHIIYDQDGGTSSTQRFYYKTFTDVRGEETRSLIPSVDELIGMDMPYDEKVERLGRHYYSDPKENLIIYIDNPNSPTGDMAHPSTIRALAKACARFPKRLLVIDEAFMDTFPDQNSAILLTEEFPNIIVIRTLSKGPALPWEKVGYAVMSTLVGREFAKVRDEHGLRRETQLLVNEILKPTIRGPYFQEIGEKIAESKTKFLNILSEIETAVGKKLVAPTNLRTPIAYFNGGDRGYQRRLRMRGVNTASGFVSPYYYDTATQTYSPISINIPNLRGRWVRMTVPANENDMPEIGDRIYAALIDKLEQTDRFPKTGY